SFDEGWIDRIVSGVDNSTSWIQPNGSTRYNVLSTPAVHVYPDVNSTTGESFRATAAWTPTSNLTFTPMFVYEKGSQGGYSAYDSTPGTQAHYQPFNLPESISDTFTLESLDAVYDARASTSRRRRPIGIAGRTSTRTPA